MILYHNNKLKIMDIADTETNLTKNLQDNGATPPVGTQIYLPYSPLEDTLVILAYPTPWPRVEAGDYALQVCTEDLPDVRLLGAYDMLFRVYQD